MKLSELRALIRKTSGNPTASVNLGNGVPMTITMQKTPLLAALGEAFDDQRTAETGLSFDPDTGTLSACDVVGSAATPDGDWEDEGHGTPPERNDLADLEDDDDML